MRITFTILSLSGIYGGCLGVVITRSLLHGNIELGLLGIALFILPIYLIIFIVKATR